MILYQPVIVDYKAKFRPGSLAAVTCPMYYYILVDYQYFMS